MLPAMIVVVMGVSGSGKTTVGRALAQRLRWPFHDADDFHSQANVDKMARGVPLIDADREPWLASLQGLLRQIGDRHAVLACSALRSAFRQRLASAGHDVRFVYLKASKEVLAQRLAQREGHYMPVSLLQSQLDTLEEPGDAIVVDAALPVDDIVERIADALDERVSGPSR